MTERPETPAGADSAEPSAAVDPTATAPDGTAAIGSRASTGIPGLDAILGGGLPARRTYLVQGEPGAGKTTLGLKFLLAGIAEGERAVYVALSESFSELVDIAASHGWDLSEIEILELHATEESLKAEAQYTFFHPSEIELSDTTQLILETVERVRPSRIVFDSLSEMRLLARDSLRYRRQLLSLKKFFTDLGSTVILLDVQPDERHGARDEFRLETLAHGFIQLEQLLPVYGDQRRRLRVGKLRGLKYQEGYHDFRIVRGGLEVYPRLVSASHESAPRGEPVTSGIPALDRLLGGGLDRGATTMFLGPAGVGKSTLATLFVRSQLLRGEKVVALLFDESPTNWRLRTEGLGIDLSRFEASGHLLLRQVDPAQLSPGELASQLRTAVVEDGVSTVLIDSMNGYRYAMPEEDFLTIHLHELFSFLNHQGVLTLVVVAQHGFLGDDLAEPLHISYLADSVILLRYFEAFGEVRKALSIVKKRTGDHERTIRELLLRPGSVDVGAVLQDFQGILGGELLYIGKQDPLLENEG